MCELSPFERCAHELTILHIYPRRPITEMDPSNQFWGVDEIIAYGTSASIIGLTAGILDSGTTLTLIATDAFKRYQAATGSTLDKTTGFLRLTLAQFSNLQSLFFTIGGIEGEAPEYEFTANAQIFPVRLMTHGSPLKAHASGEH